MNTEQAIIVSFLGSRDFDIDPMTVLYELSPYRVDMGWCA